jgi:outer membrane protein OmpA-like peptidoglycan-associated protein
MQHKNAGIPAFIALCGAVMICAATASADVPNPSLYLGFYGGGHLTMGSEWFLQDPYILDKHPGHGGLFGLRLGYMINHCLAAEGDASVIAYKSSSGGNINIALAATMDVLFHLMRGNWVPYIITGGGAYQSLSGDLGSDRDWQVRWGLGLRAMANSTVSPRFEIKHVMTDAYTVGTMFANNVEVTLGVDFFLKKGGKVPPPLPPVVDVDKDHDGVPDSADNCPDQAGTEANRGCPILDRDHDGVLDKDDACPDEAGTETNRGCPLLDRDKDGVLDKDDACPDEAGAESNRGCPLLDRDHDGVLDRDDACPEVPGLIEAKGCMPEKAAKMFSGTFEGIYFATGKATITRESYPKLNKAVAMLQEFPSIRLIIEGHTDNIGQAYKNQVLSEERAQAVKDYFVAKGVDPMRIETAGYGDTRPVASNKTATGRADNRRIEIKIKSQ